MTFYVGGRVVCIDATHRVGGTKHSVDSYLKDGGVYTIRWVGECPYEPWRAFGLHVRLVGIARPNDPNNSDWNDMPFQASRFRPVVEDRKSSSFTAGAPKDSEQWDNRRKVHERT